MRRRSKKRARTKPKTCPKQPEGAGEYEDQQLEKNGEYDDQQPVLTGKHKKPGADKGLLPVLYLIGWI
jgi:hypothetical protein